MLQELEGLSGIQSVFQLSRNIPLLSGILLQFDVSKKNFCIKLSKNFEDILYSEIGLVHRIWNEMNRSLSKWLLSHPQ